MKLPFGRSEEDFEDEIRSHIDLEVDRLIAEGVSPRAARRAAFARFGSMNTARERFYSARRLPRLELILKDAALALRGLRREPGFAAVAILTLAVGIGLNSAIFTALYSLTSRPLPLPQSGRLVTVHQQFGEKAASPGELPGAKVEIGRMVNGSPDRSSYQEYLNYRSTRAFAGLAGYANIALTLEGTTPTPVAGVLVTCNYFAVLRVKLQHGRSFADPECSRPGDVPVVILSDGLWQRRFAGDPGIIGKAIVLNRQSLMVVGIAEKKFGGTEVDPADAFIPVTMQPLFGPDQLRLDNMSWLSLIGRLSSKTSVSDAKALLTQAAHVRDAQYPGRETTVHVYQATRVPGARLADEFVTLNVAAISIAAMIVLIACLNVANLLLTRAPARQRSVRIRLSLGADRRQVIAQLLIESLVLSILAGILGLLLAMWVPRLVIAVLPVALVDLQFTPDLRVFAYTLLVSTIAAVVFGLVPALEAARVDLASAMRGDAAGAGRGVRSQRLRQSVVAAQLAGSLLLLVMAGLFARSLGRAKDIDPGYQVDGIIAFKADLERQGYTPARSQEFFEKLRARVAQMPEVKSVAYATRLPLRGRAMGPFMRGGNPDAKTEPEGEIDFLSVSADYFSTLGIPIIRGTRYPDREVQAGQPIPVIVSERTAARFWPGKDALDQSFHIGSTVYNVVGIARDTRHITLNNVDEHFFYAPLVEFAEAVPDIRALLAAGNPAADPLATPPSTSAATLRGAAPQLVVRSANPIVSAAAGIRMAREIDPSVLLTVESLADNIARQLQPARLVALFAGALGLLALLLAVVGVYSAVAYGVNQRLHEIGLRFALGATRADIVRLVLRQGRTSLIAGILLGLALATAVGTVLRGLFYGFEPIDPLTFAAMTAVLIAAALLAMVRPARRAASLDPALTLRRD